MARQDQKNGCPKLSHLVYNSESRHEAGGSWEGKQRRYIWPKGGNGRRECIVPAHDARNMQPPPFAMQRIGIVPELGPDGQMSGVYAKISAQRIGHPHAGRKQPDPSRPSGTPDAVSVCYLGQKGKWPTPVFIFSPSRSQALIFNAQPYPFALQHISPSAHDPAPSPSLNPTMGTVTTKSTMASTLDAASLFRVDGMVAVVTGGGSGTTPLPLPPPSQPLTPPQESASPWRAPSP